MNPFANEKGFTLIEVIAVVVILGILIAIAFPKYVELVQQAKIAVAKSEVAEMKSSLNMAYAKLFIANSTAPTAAADVILAAIGTSTMPITVGNDPDVWTISITGASTVAIITIQKRGTDTNYAAVGTWNIPQ